MRKVLYGVVAIAVMEAVSLSSPKFDSAPVFAQARYQLNPKIRKGKAREAMFKAMENNAKVEMMIYQESPDAAKMVQLLHDSYGLQVVAITQIEGVIREANFKDPRLERGCLDMYDVGKPNTLLAQQAIERGDLSTAISHLKNAKRVHQQFLALTY